MMNPRVEVERVANGWIVSTHNIISRREVFLSRENMLTEVYRAACDWKVGDYVEVKCNTK